MSKANRMEFELFNHCSLIHNLREAIEKDKTKDIDIRLLEIDYFMERYFPTIKYKIDYSEETYPPDTKRVSITFYSFDGITSEILDILKITGVK